MSSESSRCHCCRICSVVLVVFEVSCLSYSRRRSCRSCSAVLVVFEVSFLSSSSWTRTQAPRLRASAFITSALESDLPQSINPPAAQRTVVVAALPSPHPSATAAVIAFLSFSLLSISLSSSLSSPLVVDALVAYVLSSALDHRR